MQHAKLEQSGSVTGQVLPTLGLEACLLQLAANLEAQTEAINNLAESNFALVQAMSESDMGGDAEPVSYLNGAPRR